jgi:hypothetical protein
MIEPAYYQSKISTFLSHNEIQILGHLSNKHHFDLGISQKGAWVDQITNLKEQLHHFPDGNIFFEFSIPRMGKRVDVLLLISGVIWVIEYKIGAKAYDTHALDQAMDYALDLKNFHDGSRDKCLVPILVSTKADRELNCPKWSEDHIAHPLLSNGSDLGEIISQVLSGIPTQKPIDANMWAYSGYRPTPTIVEAAQALYRGHSVEEISRSDAGAINLTITSKCISEIIDFSSINRRKSICFITGVPGAGKTLAGLNISTQRRRPELQEYAVFLSGNGPLVNVLREALARDEVERKRAEGQRVRKREAASKVAAFVQNIHHFRDEGLKSDLAPVEQVVVFDEAQRAWNQSHAEQFMIRKRGVAEFRMSEPEFLISLMDRKSDWCTIVCLVGGGQEINTGEAGLVEWFNAIEKRFGHWDVYYSDQITHKDYSWGQDLGAKLNCLNSQRKEALHLAVSVRSFRAEKLSAFVGALIEGEIETARNLHEQIKTDYPIVITRDLGRARGWLRNRARGTERYGLVTSSGAYRLKPEGISARTAIEPVLWFLNDKNDIRSSYYLEDVATEFDIQGLELDWVGVCWDADFRRQGNEWGLYSFKGTRWQVVRDQFRRAYLANAYRVLLTRARQGMVIFVPRGDRRDRTRPPDFYDGTYEFLSSCGIERI